MSPIVNQKRRLQGHVQTGGHFRDADLRSAQAFQSGWENAEFSRSRLGMSDFRASRWVNCHMRETAFYGANFNAATLHGMVLLDCDGEQASFSGAVLRNVIFRNCRLSYASFADATLRDVVFDGCNLHGANLTMAETTNLTFAKSNLWGAVAPFGCAFWNATFTQETADRFAALCARVASDPDKKQLLIEIAGDTTYRAVCRLMDAQPEGPEF